MSRFYNRTRTSRSIPRKLLREGKLHLIPVYYLLLTSELAREGICNSGSYRFADHIYSGKPKGSLGIGYLIDALFLRMKPAHSFRTRYLYTKQEIRRLVQARAPQVERLDILAVPCGLARELFEAAGELMDSASPNYGKVVWHGLDLDPELIMQVSERAANSGHNMTFRCGDALLAASYPQKYDMVVSLGFGEFLDDQRLLEFYRLVHAALNPGGVFVTSGMIPQRFSDYLLRNIGELHTFYRSKEELAEHVRKAGFKPMRIYQDWNRLQTMVVSAKE